MSFYRTAKVISLLSLAFCTQTLHAANTATINQTQALKQSNTPAVSVSAPLKIKDTALLNAKVIKDVSKLPSVKLFINEMAQKHGFNKQKLAKLFHDTHMDGTVIEKMMKPYEALSWHKYQNLFTTPSHIEQGLEFWKANEEALKRAEAQFGVPAEVIVAIIGVETRYGRKTGDFRVIDALTTLAFEYPPRAAFFKSELEQFLLLTRELKRNPLEFKGSYAGAMGKPQFISSSYRNFAVDFSGNGKRDILSSDVDAIGSVANYFNKHGWNSQIPVAFPAKVRGKRFDRLTTDLKAPKTLYSHRDLKKAGVFIKGQAPKGLSYSFIALEAEKGPEYWVGTENFYVITRYNHSVHYAMAVYQLSQLLKQNRG